MRNKAKISQQNQQNTALKDMADDSNEAVAANLMPDKNRRDLILTHKEAEAGSPDDMAVCGEEDTGAGLEFLVTRNDHQK